MQPIRNRSRDGMIDPALAMELDLLPPEPSAPGPEHVRRLVERGEDAVVVRMDRNIVMLVRGPETAHELDDLELHSLFHQYDGITESARPWRGALAAAARTWGFIVYEGGAAELRPFTPERRSS